MLLESKNKALQKKNNQIFFFEINIPEKIPLLSISCLHSSLLKGMRCLTC